MRDQMFEREINERLKTFLNQHIEFNEYRAFIHSTSIKSLEEMIVFIDSIPGQLTATVQGELSELSETADLIEALTQKVGRILLNGFPTGVEVSGAMVHGGPFPSTTDSRSTSVGTQAIYRFTRPVCFQNFSSEMIP